MHAYANSKAHCTADWGQILINQLFALPSPKTQTAQSWTQSRDVLKYYCKMHRQWTCDNRFFSKNIPKIGQFGQMGQINFQFQLLGPVLSLSVPSPWISIKVWILWKGHKIKKNIPLFWRYLKWKIFFKFCGLLRISEL